MPTTPVNIQGPTLKLYITAPTIQALSKSDFNKAVFRVFSEEARIANRMFGKTFQTFRATNRPTFKFEFKVGTFDVEGNLFTTDTPYVFVNQGTRIRLAVMGQGYRPKTRRGVIGSRSGGGNNVAVLRGAAVIATRGLAWARQNRIEGRFFNITIAQRRQKGFEKKMQAMSSKGIQRRIRRAVPRTVVIEV